MAIFEKSMEVLDSWEGGYANNPNDPGGETYCGISRRKWPNWQGWKVIDTIKVNSKIHFNEKLPNLVPDVSAFYLENFWNRQSFEQLSNQDVADKIFQHYVNMGSRAIKLLQESANDYAKASDYIDDLTIDGALGQETVTHINSYVTQDILNWYIQNLVDYYEGLIKEHLQLQSFEHEWMLRAKTIGKRP